MNMQYEIRKVDDKSNTVRITTTDERWYQKDDGDFVPSVTWICSYYPKGIGYMKWLASKGWDEAESIKEEAGQRGSKVHHAIEKILQRKEIKIDEAFSDGEGKESELTADEWYAVMTFADWYRQARIEKIHAIELSLVNEMYGGTIDMVCEIDGEIWIIDFKTSQQVWPSHEIQISAYQSLALKDKKLYQEIVEKGKTVKLAILQVGYKKTKKGYKFTEIEYQQDLFNATYKIWEKEVSQKNPLQRDYPLTIKL